MCGWFVHHHEPRRPWQVSEPRVPHAGPVDPAENHAGPFDLKQSSTLPQTNVYHPPIGEHP